MNLFITSSCNGECSHCMSDCKSYGEYMTWSTFKSALKFIDGTGSRVVNVTGGEPSLHPDVCEFIQYAKSKYPKMLFSLISNGSFIGSEVYTKRLMSLFHIIQITYDSRFYPHEIDLNHITKNYPDIATEDTIRSVLKMGRAKTNGIELGIERESPFCFNMRSIVKISNQSLVSAAQLMEQKLKFCGWGIKPNGDVTLSESMLCPTVGNVSMSYDIIVDNVRQFRCMNCIYAVKLNKRGIPYSLIFK